MGDNEVAATTPTPNAFVLEKDNDGVTSNPSVNRSSEAVHANENRNESENENNNEIESESKNGNEDENKNGDENEVKSLTTNDFENEIVNENKKPENLSDSINSENDNEASNNLTDVPLTATSPPAPSIPSASQKNGGKRSRGETVAAIYQLLNVYEKRRHSLFQQRFHSNKMYWKATLNIMQRGKAEVSLFERFIRGRIAADEAYAEYMIACSNSIGLERDPRIIDEDSKTSTDATETKSNADCTGSQENKEGNMDFKQTDSDQCNTNGMYSTLDDTGKIVKKIFEKNSLAGKEECYPRNDSILHSISLSSRNIALKYENHIKLLENDILEEIVDLGSYLEDVLLSVEQVTKNLMLEQDQGDLNVREHWNSYSKAVEPQQVGDVDVWLRESQYRMSVAYFTTSTSKALQSSSNVFQFCKDIEILRLKRLKEITKKFSQLQELHWLVLPSTSQNSIRWIVERPEDGIEIKNWISYIHAEAKNMQNKKEHQETGILTNLISDKFLSHDEGQVRGQQIELSSPISSELLSTIKVVEKRDQGYFTTFKKTLAVSTIDGFLHFFDVPNIDFFTSNKNSTLMDVFNSLLVKKIDVPKLALPISLGSCTEKERLEKRKEIINIKESIPSRSWYDSLKPIGSIYLPKTKLRIDFDPYQNSSVVELTETISNVGAAKLFATYTTRVIYVRTENDETLHTWVEGLDM